MSDQLELLPKKLSPSRISDFHQCPKKFYYKTIEKLPDPQTEEAMRGTIAHDVLEEMYKLKKSQRTEETALQLLTVLWPKYEAKADFARLEEDKPGLKARMDKFIRKCLKNYFKIENPTMYDPTALEKYVCFEIPDGPVVHGFIDRVDEINFQGEDRTYISDYKTGKIPHPKWASKNFYAMRIYAYLMYQLTGQIPEALHLIYLQGTTRERAVLREKVTQNTITQAEQELKTSWVKIQQAAAEEKWPAKPSVLCNWCAFKDLCPEATLK